MRGLIVFIVINVILAVGAVILVKTKGTKND